MNNCDPAGKYVGVEYRLQMITCLMPQRLRFHENTCLKFRHQMMLLSVSGMAADSDEDDKKGLPDTSDNGTSKADGTREKNINITNRLLTSHGGGHRMVVFQGVVKIHARWQPSVVTPVQAGCEQELIAIPRHARRVRA
ncbi:MAG: hypothetical protein ACOYOU_10195 [Kiritimatiellia bacterium]